MDHAYGFNVGNSLQEQDPERLWENVSLAAECMDNASARVLADRINASEDPIRFTLPLSHATYGILSAAAADPARNARHADRLSELLLLLKPAMLAGALRSETDPGARQTLLSNAAAVLRPAALTRVAFAAGAAWERPLSAPLRELFRGISRLATSGTEQGALSETLLRELIGTHVHLASVNGNGITRQGDHVSRRPPRRPASRVTPEPDRVLHLALEIGTTGDGVWIAVDSMVHQGRAREIFDAVKQAPESTVGAAIVRRIATPAALTELLSEDPIDGDLLDLVLSALGIAAAKPMVEVLAESRSRTTRRAVLDRLSRLGTDIAPLVEARLRDSRWFVVRNMLTLLREAGCTDSVRHGARFMQHTDARVRREAILFLLESPTTADEALVLGLRDPEKNVVRAALQAARRKLPDAGVPVLAERVTQDPTFPPEFRVMALHILGRSRNALALDALLHFAQGGRSLLGRPRLAQTSPELLAALGGLARSWSADRRAKALLDVAARSRDERIARAAESYDS